MTPTRLVPMALLAAALLAAGCGSSDKKKSSSSTPAATTQQSAPPATETSASDTSTVAPAAQNGPKVKYATDLSRKPIIEKPTGDTPAFLVAKDLVVGRGQAAETGDTVTVQYVGVSWSTGKEFDASWDRHEPLTFPLGQGQVIAGWDQGVVGMHVGGRRELVIPPALGYGPDGSPPAILPNETLVFVVDLKSIG